MNKNYLYLEKRWIEQFEKHGPVIITNKFTGEIVTIAKSYTKFCKERNIKPNTLYSLLIGKTKIIKEGWFLGKEEPKYIDRKGEKRKPMSEASKLLRCNTNWEGVVIKNYISGKEIILGKNIKNCCSNNSNENVIEYGALRRLLRQDNLVSRHGWFLVKREKEVNEYVCGICDDCKHVFTFENSMRTHGKTMRHNVTYFYKEKKILTIENDNPVEYEENRTPNIIYKIINLHNNKFYIGSSTRGKERWEQHKRTLNGNSLHHNTHLQNSWKQYGEQAFKFKVVEYLPKDYTPKQVTDIEQQYLDKHCGKEYCYNVSPNAYEPPTELNKKPIKQLDKNTRELIRIWPSTVDAERETNILHGIPATCKGINASAGGFAWEFADENEAKKYTPNMRSHGGHGKRAVVVIHPLTYEILEEYNSIESAAQANNSKHYAPIIGVCSGRGKSYMGKVFKYKDEIEDYIINNQSNNNPKMICKICNVPNNSLKGLATHIQFSHKMTSKEYTEQYIINGKAKCAHAGCNIEPRYCRFEFMKFCIEHAKIAMSLGGREGGKFNKNILPLIKD